MFLDSRQSSVKSLKVNLTASGTSLIWKRRVHILSIVDNVASPSATFEQSLMILFCMPFCSDVSDVFCYLRSFSAPSCFNSKD